MEEDKSLDVLSMAKRICLSLGFFLVLAVVIAHFFLCAEVGTTTFREPR